MVLNNKIVSGISRYRKEYVKFDRLPDLYCSKNDGTHLPLVIRVDHDENVYLYCLSCDFEKQAGLVTLDNLMRLMKWRDLNPTLQFLDTEIKI